MKEEIKFVVCLVAVLIVGCEGDKSTSEEVASIIDELDRLETELYAFENNVDRNGDGKPDLFVEHKDGYVYELYDRNFDGKVDESWKFDSNSNMVSGKVDENLDGILETEHLYKDYSLDKVLSDTNGNFIADVYTKFDRGVVVYSERYYSTANGAKIGKVIYSFGHPVGPEVLIETTISEGQFEDDRK